MKRLIGELSRITKVKENEPMRDHTTFRIGGPARYFAEPASEEELKQLIAAARDFSLPYVVIGRGSNLLVDDEGVDALVVHLGDRFSGVDIRGRVITARSGTSLAALAGTAGAAGLTGLEFAAGIPGSLGGAVYMNAGAYGGEMKDVVAESRYLDEEGAFHTVTNHAFGYRKSLYTGKPWIITSARLTLNFGEEASIRATMATLAQKRREKQPLTQPSAGSVFKRPEGHFAGMLIEQAGLKGMSVGGAKVSEKHAGFIVNTGNATCDDVLRLIEKIQKAVQETSGVLLETEIKRL